jgi:hypothetical protein
MTYRVLLALVSITILFVAGCRTGEYRADQEIYERMPQLLAESESANNYARNEDGSIKVEFDKGTMLIWLRTGSDMDEVAREKAASDALEIFHEQYMNSETNRHKDGSMYRKTIGMKAYVEDVELYVFEWDLDEENPVLTNNRAGNFF